MSHFTRSKMDECRTNVEERTGKLICDGSDTVLKVGKTTRGAKCELHTCVHCARPFKEAYALKLHVRRKHTEEKPFKCTTCGKEFSTGRSLKEHALDHVDTWPFLCTACGRQFKRGYQLTSHKRVHSGERPFSCIECGEAFGQATTLARHSLIHSGERPYVCGVCDQGFRQRASLKLHAEVCGSQSGDERFGQSKLDVHQTTNSERIPSGSGSAAELLQCTACLKQYMSRMGLLYHMKTQHGVVGKRTSAGLAPSYTCDICSKTLQSSNGLATHLRIHNGERPFECGTCGDRFSNKSHLRRHEKRNSTNRISCPMCRSGFISRWEVRRHLGCIHKLSADAIEEALLKCKRLVVSVDGPGCREKRMSQNQSTQLGLSEGVIGIIDGDLDYGTEAFGVVASDAKSQNTEQPKISVEAILEQLMTNLSSSLVNNNSIGSSCDFPCDVQINDEAAAGGDINLDSPESGSMERYIENHMNRSGEDVTQGSMQPFDDIDVTEPDSAWLASMDSAIGDYEGCGDIDALVAATDVSMPEAAENVRVGDDHIVVSVNGGLRLLDLASVDNWLNDVILERDVTKGE